MHFKIKSNIDFAKIKEQTQFRFIVYGFII